MDERAAGTGGERDTVTTDVKGFPVTIYEGYNYNGYSKIDERVKNKNRSISLLSSFTCFRPHPGISSLLTDVSLLLKMSWVT